MLFGGRPDADGIASLKVEWMKAEKKIQEDLRELKRKKRDD